MGSNSGGVECDQHNMISNNLGSNIGGVECDQHNTMDQAAELP